MEKIRGYGVEALPSAVVDVDAPFCSHGPTLLFERYYASKEPRRFFACSVHRNRKGCPFFHWADEPISEDKRERWMSSFREAQCIVSRPKLQTSLVSIQSLRPGQRHYCHECSVLYTESDIPRHLDHPTVSGVTDEALLKPTTLLTPVDNKKSQAQFYFSKSFVQLLSRELSRLEFSHVLCVGTPRLHELLACSEKFHSLLLDIDHRYAQFFSVESFQRYNMFTSYFYEEGGREKCQEFLTSAKKVAIVMDPPFGGLATVLATGLQELWRMAGTELTTFLVFPYFMEGHVTEALPSLWMMDYQVAYENHKHFSATSKKPSPVRVFTNFPRPGLKLPATQGYQLCALCNKYVAKHNTHCDMCDTCPSKNGTQYRHCFNCEQCVKPGYVHCVTCKKCELPKHQCGQRAATATVVGCHVCGSLEHKRRDCPKTKAPPQARKRKAAAGSKKAKVKKLKK